MNQGTVVYSDDFDEVALTAFLECVRASLASKSGPVRIALSGGTTPKPLFEKLRSAKLPWNWTEWYWVDERFVAKEDARSNSGEASRLLFDHIRGVHVFPFADPSTGSLENAAASYDALIKTRFGNASPVFDVVVLGIGDDGHTASLFPNEPEVAVKADGAIAVAVPSRNERDPRLTLTAPVLQRANYVVVLAKGNAKLEPLRRARGLTPTTLAETPASLLLEATGQVLYVVDKELGAQLG
jgi:6-phosphogluconolactonase